MGYIEKVDSVRKPKDTWKIIYTNICEMVKVKGITIAELEKQIGAARGYICKDRTDIPTSRMLLIAEMLDCNAEQLWDTTFTIKARKMALDTEIARLEQARKELDNEIDERRD